jgi:putative serine protease PepD
MNRQVTASVLIIGILIGAAALFAVTQVFSDDDNSETEQASNEPVATSTAEDSLSTSGQVQVEEDCLTAADVYERVSQSVVVITVSSSGGAFEFPNSGAGSGIVLDVEGHILTNDHVVSGADTVEVRFADGTIAPAEVVGEDPSNDLAVIVVDPSSVDLPEPVALGDTSALRIGDPVLAIGNPFNFEGTLTQGIVSGLDRIQATGAGNARPLRNLIQTDAPVNPGNSGGPLLNCRGEVVGINTLIENPTGDNVNVGIAFAVSIDVAKRSLDDLEAGQTVSHPWLGIAGAPLTPALAEELGIDTDAGVYVTYVAPEGPAAAAGVQGAFEGEQEAAQSPELVPGGDVITAVDGEAVTSVEELAGYLDSSKEAGDTVEVTIIRDGGEQTIEVTLEEWPAAA